MKKDDLLTKTETRESRNWNICIGALFILGVFVVFVGSFGIVYCIFYEKSGLFWVLGCSGVAAAMSLYCPLRAKFRQKHFEIHKDKFSLIRVGLLDLLKKKTNFIPFSSVRRVEIEKRTFVRREDVGKKLFLRREDIEKIRARGEFGYDLVIYTLEGSIIVLTRIELENDAMEKLITAMKNYFEKEKIEVEWSNKLSSLIQRRGYCRKIIQRYGK